MNLSKNKLSLLNLLLLMSSVSWGARGTIVQFQCPGFPPTENDPPLDMFLSQYDFSMKCGDGGMPSGPKITIGHSVGGNNAYTRAASSASDMICATPCSFKHEDAPPQSSMKEVPVFIMTGDGDFGAPNVLVVQTANQTGLREAIAWHMNHEHNYNAMDLIYLFWAQSINLRYRVGTSKIVNTPRDEGWLGDLTRANWETECPYIDSYKNYNRDKSKAGWFPSRYFAYCWRAFVPLKGRAWTSPMIMTTPMKQESDKPWLGYPVFDKGVAIPIKIQGIARGEDRVDIMWGDNLIESKPGNPFGTYSTTWKNPEPGIHGLLAVAYKKNVAIATSRLVVVFIKGTVRYVPPATVSLFKAKNSDGNLMNPSLTKSFIFPNQLLPLSARCEIYSLQGQRIQTNFNATEKTSTGAGMYLIKEK